MNKRILRHSLLFYTLCWTLIFSVIIVQTEDAVPTRQNGLKNVSAHNTSSTVTDEEKASDGSPKSSPSDSAESAHIHSSFGEVVETVKPFVQAEAASQNSGVANDITSQPVVFTLKDAATAELRQRAEVPPLLHGQQDESSGNDTEKVAKATLGNATDEEARSEGGEPEKAVKAVQGKDNLTSTEDIPSFSEWTQKQLEEAEKKKVQVNVSVQNQSMNGKTSSGTKLRSKNYASPDCGAKIVAANPEAVSPSSVLSPSRDEYKLNTCTSRIWFIVELCEAVQAKKIDLANFELFSSSPKDFTVSISDRFPTRDWSLVGQFTAKDERDIQSFDLYPHLFGRYMKVEIKSHYGSEHFCPISLFRVYGTSEFEALEKEDQANANTVEDDLDDETLDSGDGEAPKNLFSSATDAVISIVKKAAEVLGNKGNASHQTVAENRFNQTTNTSILIDSCTTPSHLVVCNNCSDVLFGNVYHLLSCHAKSLVDLLKSNFIRSSLCHSDICKSFGLDFRRGIPESSHVCGYYLNSFFSPKYLGALCNTLAVDENKVVLNTTQQFPNVTEKVDKPPEIVNIETSEPALPEIISTKEMTKSDELQPTDVLSAEKILESTDSTAPPDLKISSQIKPTKALNPEDSLSISSEEDITLIQPTESLKSEEKFTDTNMEKLANLTPTAPVEATDVPRVENQVEIEIPVTENTESAEETLEELANDTSQTVTPSTVPVQAQKESVFLRLSNRIKALERNMSLSGQYLEELSRRYKKQVEEIQKLFDKTLTSLNAEAKQKDEHNKRLEKQLAELREVVDSLVAERKGWSNVFYWIFLVCVLVFCSVSFCQRSATSRRLADEENAVEIQRRNSIDVITHTDTPKKKKRRPSEEALKIKGSYKELLVDDTDGNTSKGGRKRKKRKESPKSINFVTLPEESDSKAQETLSRQESAPPILVDKDWVESNEIKDVPVVLEESEHTSIDFTPSVNGDATHLQSVIRTATEVRLNRSSSHTPQDMNGNKPEMHRKSASVDETSRAESLNGSLLTKSSDGTPKKEKKGLFKIFKRKLFRR